MSTPNPDHVLPFIFLSNQVTLIQSQIRNRCTQPLVPLEGDSHKSGTTNREEEEQSEENKEGTQRVFQLNHRFTHSNSNNDDQSSSLLGASPSSTVFGESLSYDIATSKDEVAVLLSGGVDSSVDLKLLLLQGYKVSVLTLSTHLVTHLMMLMQSNHTICLTDSVCLRCVLFI